ncbi:hypothetical protein [Streptomyces sp. NPDC056255]|uniref:hypothetical protein n=1 Tax=Streptomyces sp. NPDC056255 TaxID=3345764 RepID=UPI0035D7F9BA
MQPTAFDTLLKDVLAEEFRVLVCDEAQWLREESFEYFRHLFDDLYTDIAVVFGGNTYQVLASKDMLASRVHIWQEFTSLTRVEVLTTASPQPTTSTTPYRATIHCPCPYR